MSKITIHRKNRLFGMIVGMAVVIDDDVVCNDLASGHSKTFDISPGKHSVFVELSSMQTLVKRAPTAAGSAFVKEREIGEKRVYSNTIKFDLKSRETLSFECGTRSLLTLPFTLLETTVEMLTLSLLKDKQHLWLSRL